MTPRISLILVTHNSAADLPRCLRALPEAAEGLPFETIVVDTASTDDTVAVARATAVPLTVVEMENRGFAAAANRGASYATGAFLFFVNPDTVLPPRSLPRLATLCLRDDVAAVSGLLVNARGNIEPVGEPFPSLWWYIRRRVRPPTLPPVAHGPWSVPFLSGAALLVRRERFQQVRGFREAYFLYYEDIDLCRRLRAVGGVLLVDPDVRIFHTGGHSAPPEERLALSDQAEDVYFSLHRPRWEGVVLRVLRRLFRLVPRPSATSARFFSPPVVMFCLAAVCGMLLGRGGDFFLWMLGGVAAATVLVLTARVPDAGVVLLLGSLLPGQFLRLPLGPLDFTLTDAVLPWVVGGWLLAFWKARRHASPLRDPRSISRHPPWGAITLLGVLAAVVPGLLLAAERLPAADWVTALGYAGRVLLVLALLPLGAHVVRRKMLAPAGLVVVGVLLAFLGFLQLVFFPHGSPSTVVSAVCAWAFFPLCPTAGWDPHPGRLFSTWLDPNLLGGLFVMALAVLVSVPAIPRVAARLFLLVAGILLTVALVLTQSRTSLVALLAVLGLSFGLLRPWRRWFPLVTAAAAGLLLVPSFVARIQHLNVTDPTVALRVQSWSQALEHFSQAPLFGVGYNAYGFEQLMAGNIASLALHSRGGADNSFLTFGATTGLWGITFLLFLLNALVWVLLRKTKEQRGGVLPAMALLAFSGMVVHAQFVHSLVYIHLLVPLTLLLSGSMHPPKDSQGRQNNHAP